MFEKGNDEYNYSYPLLNVIVPVYNEEKSIKELLLKFIARVAF